jgi:SOS-response transcriptional repressor LexA
MEPNIGNFTAAVNGYLTGRETPPRRSYYRPMLQDVLSRIEERLRVVGLSAAAASRQAGLSEDAIRNLKRAVKEPDGRKGVSTRTITALAPVLQTSAAWLLTGEASDAGASAGPTSGSTIEELPARGAFGLAKVDGSVQAGAFLALEVFDDDLGEVVSAPRDPVFPFAKQRAYRVKGDSMNQARPKPMNDGDYIICAAWEDLDLEPKDGLNVVVQQTTADGQLRERSVKEIRVFPDRTEFHPRSSNPAYKPIVVKKDYHTDDGKEVTILALVRFVFDNQALPV